MDNKKILAEFKHDKAKKYGNVFFNDVKKSILIKTRLSKKVKVYSYSDLINFHISNKKQVITTTKQKGAISRGLLGGALLGPAGAVIGSATAKKTSTSNESQGQMKVSLYFLDGSEHNFHMMLESKLNQLSAKLETIVRTNMKENSLNDQKKETIVKDNYYEDIKQLRKLFDEGLITEEEFSLKKEQILNL